MWTSTLDKYLSSLAARSSSEKTGGTRVLPWRLCSPVRFPKLPFLLFPCPGHPCQAAVAVWLRNLTSLYMCRSSSYKPAFGAQAGECLGGGIRSRGPCWQGYILPPPPPHPPKAGRSLDDSTSDSYCLILFLYLAPPASVN